MLAHIGIAETEKATRVTRVVPNHLVKESDGLLELSRGDVGGAELLLIGGVAGIGAVGFFKGRNGLWILASCEIKGS